MIPLVIFLAVFLILTIDTFQHVERELQKLRDRVSALEKRGGNAGGPHL